MRRFLALMLLACSAQGYAAAPTLITTVPVTISVPGSYLVNNALSYAGAAGTAAITVTTNDVFINFDHFTLTLSTNTIGVLAQNVSDLEIVNGTIQSTAVSADTNSNAIRLLPAEHVVIDNMVFKNTRRGVFSGVPFTLTPGVVDLHVTNSYFQLPGAAAAGISSSSSQGITVENCVFNQIGTLSSGAIAIFNGDTSDVSVQNVKVLNSNKASNAIGVSIAAFNRPITNFLVQNSEFDNCDVAVGGSSFATTLAGSTGSNVTVQNCSFKGTNGGVLIQAFTSDFNSTLVENCTFDGCLLVGRALSSSTGGGVIHSFTMRDCVASNIGAVSPGALGHGIFFQGQGCLIENCVFEAAPTNSGSLGLFGVSTQGNFFSPAHDVIIKNSTFLNRQARPEATSILIPNADGVLIDGCILDSNASGIFTPVPNISPPSANIQLGSLVYDAAGVVVPGLGTNAHNVKIVNTLIHNNSQFGIISQTGDNPTPNQNIVIEDCAIDGAAEAGIFFVNTISSVVRNCHVKDITGNINSPGHGIVLADALPLPYLQDGKCQFNEISNNTVANCGGTGILVQSRAQNNFVVHNETFSNREDGFNNEGDKTNQFYDNSSCNNLGMDCLGNIPRSLLNHPGSSHVTLRQNSCCKCPSKAALQQNVEKQKA